jgi:hypothetical protein
LLLVTLAIYETQNCDGNGDDNGDNDDSLQGRLWLGEGRACNRF